MKFRKFITCVIVAGLAALFSTSQAQEMIYSGFMTDYTQLEKITDGSMDYRYTGRSATIFQKPLFERLLFSKAVVQIQ